MSLYQSYSNKVSVRVGKSFNKINTKNTISLKGTHKTLNSSYNDFLDCVVYFINPFISFVFLHGSPDKNPYKIFTLIRCTFLQYFSSTFYLVSLSCVLNELDWTVAPDFLQGSKIFCIKILNLCND